jgi:dihydrofolate synthase / folylpolyglutamate synthase
MVGRAPRFSAPVTSQTNANAFLANFARLTRHIFAVQIPDRDNAMPPDRLADAARALGMRVETLGCRVLV